MKNIPFHPLADIFPLIHGREFVELKADISQHGVREPIWMLGGQILDGRNRFRAAQEVGVTPEFRDYEGGDPAGFVISLNLHRRHLTESQRAAVAAKLANMEQGARTDIQPSANLQKVSVADAAKLLNVSERSVHTAKAIQRDGAEEIQQAVSEGKVSLNAAIHICTLPKDEQREVAAKDSKEMVAIAKEIRASKADQELTTAEHKKRAPTPPKPSCSKLISALQDLSQCIATGDRLYRAATDNQRAIIRQEIKHARILINQLYDEVMLDEAV